MLTESSLSALLQSSPPNRSWRSATLTGLNPALEVVPLSLRRPPIQTSSAAENRAAPVPPCPSSLARAVAGAPRDTWDARCCRQHAVFRPFSPGKPIERQRNGRRRIVSPPPHPRSAIMGAPSGEREPFGRRERNEGRTSSNFGAEKSSLTCRSKARPNRLKALRFAARVGVTHAGMGGATEMAQGPGGRMRSLGDFSESRPNPFHDA